MDTGGGGGQVLPAPFSADIQGEHGEHFIVRQKVSIFFLAFPVFFIVAERVCGSAMFHGGVYLFPVFLGGRCDIPLYKKQTAPTSTPNS